MDILPLYLATSTQLRNMSSSTYTKINNDNAYQGMIRKNNNNAICENTEKTPQSISRQLLVKNHL